MKKKEKLFSKASRLWAFTNTIARPLLSIQGEKLDVPVISVGNILAGGVGKTETSIAIANFLLKKGLRVTVSSRGYASDWENRAAYATDYTEARELKFPDESLVLLRKAPGAAVTVGKDRRSVLRRYWKDLKPDVVILDDGHQHFAIRSDVKILVHDFSLELPIYRDLENQFSKADHLISFSEVPARYKKLNWVSALYVPKTKLPARANVVCGIGNPDRLKRFLEKNGCEVAQFIRLRDHADYSQGLVENIADSLRDSKLPCLVTLKDYVKLEGFVDGRRGTDLERFPLELQWIDIDLELGSGSEKFWSDILLAVKK